MDKETYRVQDHMGYTKLLVYRKKYNPDLLDTTTNQYGCYQDTIAIETIGETKETT